jgi:hypothetical protein
MGGRPSISMTPSPSIRHPQAPPKFVYNVKFKRAQRSFILSRSPGSPFPYGKELKIGAYVIVEADRGEDLGIVMSRVAVDRFNAQVRTPPKSLIQSCDSSSMSPPTVLNAAGCLAADLTRILRVASAAEVYAMQEKVMDEAALLKLCRTKVKQRQFPMVVLDAEYQYDRNKLTFFFHAEGRIDFRELVRDLFSLYKTRIWMQQVSGAEGLAFEYGDEHAGQL